MQYVTHHKSWLFSTRQFYFFKQEKDDYISLQSKKSFQMFLKQKTLNSLLLKHKHQCNAT
jgi:hypothetical protein